MCVHSISKLNWSSVRTEAELKLNWSVLLSKSNIGYELESKLEWNEIGIELICSVIQSIIGY